VSRHKVLVGSLVGLFVICALGLLITVLMIGRGEGRGLFVGDRIALLPLEGAIMTDERFLRHLQRFREDRSVKGIVVYIDSPGGAVAPSQSIYQELRKARDEGMPVVAAIGSVGASGGYYAALGADSIFVMPGSITGSIGVILQFPNVEELAEKVGISMEVVKSSELKDIGSPFRPVSPEDRSVLESMVADIYDQFVETVAEERGLSRAQLAELADGRILSGRQAIAAGLADGVGNLPDAIAAAGRMAGLGDDPRVVRPPEPRLSLLQLLLSGGSEVAGRLRSGLDQLQTPSVRYIAH